MRPKNYTHLQPAERDQIAVLAAQGDSITSIAERIGRNKSTVCRELRRNADSCGQYTPFHAQGLAASRKAAAGRRYALKNGWLRAYVSSKMALRWSPERISGRLSKEHPGSWGLNASTEAIYQYLYSASAEPALKELLPRRHKRRGARDRRGRKKLKILDRTPIDERSEAANLRLEFGNWEGDTIVSRGHKGGLATMVERTSRYVMATQLEDGTAAAMSEALMKAFSALPAHARKSITLDNGGEFARHQDLHALGTKTYFADPYSSWQRGSNENANGLIRRWYPKGTDFSTATPGEVAECVALINNLPRKCLGWSTSAEVFAILLQRVRVALPP
jgi:IS30 family transposase